VSFLTMHYYFIPVVDVQRASEQKYPNLLRNEFYSYWMSRHQDELVFPFKLLLVVSCYLFSNKNTSFIHAIVESNQQHECCPGRQIHGDTLWTRGTGMVVFS
jgi:hypothetical protein